MNKVFTLFLILLFFVPLSAFAGGYSASSDTVTIKEIIGSARYLNQIVEVRARFMGWQSRIGPPPVSRSDYIIEDETGQIYVTGRLPKGLSAQSLKKEVYVQGRVKAVTRIQSGKEEKVIYLQLI